MIIKKLNGHSGCEVYLMKDRGCFVRKISSSPAYNDRLNIQLNKQRKFCSHVLQTPEVTNEGFIDGKLYFDMEYIRGSSFHEFVQKENISNVKNIFSQVLDFIETNNDLTENIKDNILQKIDSLRLPPRYKRYVDYCRDFEWDKIQKSYCHGDLTFENLIASRDGVFLIDFLDSFTDTKLIDYAKIFQELYCFWSYRDMDKNFNITYIILDQMIRLGDFKRRAALKLLTLNLLRILPYANKGTTQFIDYQLKYVTEEIDGK